MCSSLSGEPPQKQHFPKRTLGLKREEDIGRFRGNLDAMSDQDTDHRRDAMLLAALRKPPEPRKKRDRRDAKAKPSESHASGDGAKRAPSA